MRCLNPSYPLLWKLTRSISSIQQDIIVEWGPQFASQVWINVCKDAWTQRQAFPSQHYQNNDQKEHANKNLEIALWGVTTHNLVFCTSQFMNWVGYAALTHLFIHWHVSLFVSWLLLLKVRGGSRSLLFTGTSSKNDRGLTGHQHLVKWNKRLTNICCFPASFKRPGQTIWLSSYHHLLQVKS